MEYHGLTSTLYGTLIAFSSLHKINNNSVNIIIYVYYGTVQ